MLGTKAAENLGLQSHDYAVNRVNLKVFVFFSFGRTFAGKWNKNVWEGTRVGPCVFVCFVVVLFCVYSHIFGLIMLICAVFVFFQHFAEQKEPNVWEIVAKASKATPIQVTDDWIVI